MSSKAIVPLALGAIAAGTIVATGGTAAPAMAGLAASLPSAATVATAASVGGLGLTAYGQMQQAAAANQAAKGDAEELKYNARMQRAEGSMRAQEVMQQGKFAESRARAVAGASGTSGGNINRIISDLAAETRLRADLAMFGSNATASSLQLSARGRRSAGRGARDAGRVGTAATLLSGGSSLYERYG